ncbi:unknown [Cryptobacterium sp. CAG:338]|nr:unknown [Cryptobacterium sp. CAG:338]
MTRSTSAARNTSPAACACSFVVTRPPSMSLTVSGNVFLNAAYCSSNSGTSSGNWGRYACSAMENTPTFAFVSTSIGNLLLSVFCCILSTTYAVDVACDIFIYSCGLTMSISKDTRIISRAACKSSIWSSAIIWTIKLPRLVPSTGPANTGMPHALVVSSFR